ncbi:MAG: PKD-like domain-containing protein [Saprospiraceae bacterium]
MTHRIAPTFSLARFSASFLLKLILVFGVQNAWSQCPTVEAIMVDACGSESLNEFIIINSGGGFNTADIELSYDLNNNILSPQNNDINIDLDNLASDPTPCNLQVGNPGVLSGCSNVIPVGPGIAIPPNSIVVLQTSAGANNLYDFSALCGMGECVYVISSACARTAGGFTNSGSGTRETIFQIAGGCQQFIVYDRAALVGGNGAYYLPVSGAYGNDGCVVPPTSPAPLPPDVDPLPNVMECGSYTLPAITGTNLSGNEGYFTGPNRTGTQLFPGDMITTTTTIYINDFSAQGCEDEEMFTVTISPAPVVNPVADQTVCQGTPVSVVFSGTPGASFDWTNDNTAIGLGGSGTGNISFNSSTSGSQEIATITVTPSIGMCVGTPETFMITVNPNPTVNNPGNQSVCGGDQPDIFFSGSGSATSTGQTTIRPLALGGSGSGDISFTANNVVNQTTGQITVTPSENGCVGTPQTFQIIVNPAPFVNAVADITDCPGAAIVVNFSGTFGATFNWTNDNPAIGLAPAGSGGISFIADNTGIQQMATITVTPSLNGCVGTPITFTITIEPNPTLFNPGDQTYCSGDQVNLFLTGNDATGFVWTNSNTAIGLAGAGAGDIVFTAANVSMLTQGTITVTPQSALCTGMDEQFVITITPAPEADPIADITTCGGQPITQAITGTSGVQFNWTNSNPAIGLPASGTGDIDFISAQVANSETGTITITPVNGNCMGVTTSFSITVDPGPTSDPVADLTICAGDTVDIQILGSSGAVFNWINDNTNSGLAASGSDTIFFIGTASGMPEISTVIINPEENGCLGPADTVIIQVNPIPQFDNPGNSSVCSGQNALIPITGTPANASFDWTNNNLGIGLPEVAAVISTSWQIPVQTQPPSL